MKQILLAFAMALPLLAQQTFDFSTLDKLGANATNKSNITMDSDMLKLASGVLGGTDKGGKLKELVSGLNSMSIRSFEFDKEGKYSEADVEPFRAFLRDRKWNRIVDSVEGKDHSEIYVQARSDKQVGGFALISCEAREVSVIFIDGAINLDDLGKLSGTMGIPNIRLDHAGSPARVSGLQKELDDLQLERAGRLAEVSAAHPSVRKLDAQIKFLQEQIAKGKQE